MSYFKIILILLLIPLFLNAGYDSYEIMIPGEATSDGFFSPAKRYTIKQNNYHKNRLYIKTSMFEEISYDGASFKSEAIADLLKDVRVVAITRPFATFDFNQLSLSIPQIRPTEFIYEIELATGQDAFAAAKQLNKSTAIEYAVPKFYQHLAEHIPNDELFIQQYVLDRVSATQAWDISKSSNLIKIAIVDSGIEMHHDDLKNKAWVNKGEIPSDNIDNDNNGFVDDVYGWDFVGDISLDDFNNDLFKPDNSTTPTHPSNYHGTHVAGLAAASTNNAIGMASIGYNAKFISIKVTFDNHSQTSEVPVAKGYDAIFYAAKLGADIINCSWNSDEGSPVEESVIATVTEMGSLVVAAAGNEGTDNTTTPQYPASYPGVLSVGATTNSDIPTNYTNFGIAVDVFAPGHQALSTLPGNTYGKMNGTSMATPIVSGIAALIKSKDPDSSPATIAARIRITSDYVFDKNKYPRNLFFGRANALKALQEKIYGIEVISVEYSNSASVLTDSLLEVSLTLYNAFDDLENFAISISQLDALPYVDMDPKSINVATFPHGDTLKVKFELRLNRLDPWYSGETAFLVDFASKDFSNNYFFKVQIYSKTLNKVSVYSQLDFSTIISKAILNSDSSSVLIGGNSIADPSNGIIIDLPKNEMTTLKDRSLWQIYYDKSRGSRLLLCDHRVNGNRQILRYLNSSNLSVELSVDDSLSEIFDYEGQPSVIAYSGDSLKLYHNIGKQWDSNPLPFKSDLLDPSKISNITSYGDKIFFILANSASIYVLNDLALDSIQLTEEVKRLEYINAVGVDSLFLMYKTNTSTKAGLLIASEVPIFKPGLNEVNAALSVENVHAMPDSYTHIIYCSGGEIIATSDFGDSWRFIKNTQFRKDNLSDISTNGNEVYLYLSGKDISRLELIYLPKEPNFSIEYSKVLNFGKVDLGLSADDSIELINKGNVSAYVFDKSTTYSAETSPNEISILSEPNKINPGESFELPISFAPLSIGEKYAELIYNFHLFPQEFRLKIFGLGQYPAGVAEDLATDVLLYPMPADDFFEIHSAEKINLLEVYDLIGKRIMQLRPNAMQVRIDTQSLRSGIYLIKITTDSGTSHRHIVIE